MPATNVPIVSYLVTIVYLSTIVRYSDYVPKSNQIFVQYVASKSKKYSALSSSVIYMFFVLKP